MLDSVVLVFVCPLDKLRDVLDNVRFCGITYHKAISIYLLSFTLFEGQKYGTLSVEKTTLKFGHDTISTYTAQRLYSWQMDIESSQSADTQYNFYLFILYLTSLKTFVFDKIFFKTVKEMFEMTATRENLL